MELQANIKNELIDWYWNLGSTRKGTYALSRGGWLDNALRISSEILSVNRAQTLYNKPTIALWGPSQSGKSTLLAKFIDAGATDDGQGSALSWDNTPARFSGDNKGGTVAVLNPYSHGADASGCVTRFHLTDKVKYPEYPVEVHFAGDHDILLSLAVGYLSETIAVTQSGEERHLRPDDLREIAAKANIKGAADKEAYILLTEVLDVVDVLIDMDLPRYVNLRKEWQNRRSNLLNNDALISSTENVIKFACELLWDDWKNMNDLYLRLRSKLAQLGQQKIYCGIEIGALMLNIASAVYYNESDYVRNLVNACCLKELGDGDVAIVKGGGSPLFANDVDFALGQGLVSLIKVPLRSDVISNSHPAVYELLQQADLVDFPGVANEHKNAERLTNDKLSFDYRNEHGVRPLLSLTQVMKRGKTASIVISSARNLNIDAFSLLVRMPAGPLYPANPVQLMNGIRQWFKSMGKAYNPLSRDGEMQINLILTFSATLLNVVNASGTGVSGLSGVFSKLKSMGDLADPAVVRTFCVNYPMFPDGHIQIDTDARKREVIDMILADQHFKRQFNGTETSLSQMADLEEGSYGGRIYFFNALLEQIKKSRRLELLTAKMTQLEQEWNDCLAQALPPADGEDSHERDLELVIKAIRENHDTASDAAIAKEILDFKDISPEMLEIAPTGNQELYDYLQKQLATWQENSRRKPLQTSLGFENAEHRARVISYLVGSIDILPMYKWLCPVTRSLSHRQQRSELRRLIAIFFAKLLFPNTGVHRPERESVELLENMSTDNILTRDVAKRENNIYYISVIAPFLNNLEKLKAAGQVGKRGVQPGDAELLTISTKTTAATDRA